MLQVVHLVIPLLMLVSPSSQDNSLANLLTGRNATAERRFGPFTKLQSTIANFDIKNQLNSMYDKFQPWWGTKNSPKSFGSVIAEISSTQPGAESMTSYTVPGSGITHIKSDSGSSSSSSSSSESSSGNKLDTLSSSLFTSTDDDEKMMTSESTSRSKRYFPDIPVSDHPVRTYSSRGRDRDYDRDHERDRERDPPRDRRRRRRIRKRGRSPYRDVDERSYPSLPPYPMPMNAFNFLPHMPIPFNINSPFGSAGPSPVLFGAKAHDSKSEANDRPDRMTAADSSHKSVTSASNIPFPMPFPLMFPPGMPPMPMIPGMPPPFMSPIPGMSPFSPFPMVMSLQNLATAATTTTTPAPRTRTPSPPATIIEDDGSITIAGIRPQSIVNKINDVVRQTGMNKVIGSAISSVLTQVKDAGTSVASQVAKNIGDSVSLSLVSDGDSGHSSSGHSRYPKYPSSSSSSSSSSASRMVKLGEAKISFKPTNSGLSITLGKAR